MTFEQPQTLRKIAEIIGARFIGDENFPVFGTNEIHMVREGDIVFVNHPKYYDKALNSNATIILIDKEVECPKGKALLVSDDPFRDFNKINTYFTKISNFKENLDDAIVGEGTFIHPSVVIGNGVRIGKNCHIRKAIIDKNARIGDNVSIGMGEIPPDGDYGFYHIVDQIYVITKNAIIPNNTTI